METEQISIGGKANVTALFRLSDGQTIVIYFHNPDATPKKIAPTDDLISYKWLLNKRDITIVVAPERGEDLNVNEVAKRIMKLAEKNSPAFVRANGKRAERMQNLANLTTEIAGLEVELKAAQNDLEAAKIEAEDRAAAQAVKKSPPMMLNYTSTKSFKKISVDVANAPAEDVLDAYNSLMDYSDTGGFPGSEKWKKGRKFLETAEKIGSLRPDVLALRKKIANDKYEARLALSSGYTAQSDYERLSTENPGIILLYRMGDFYNVLGNNAAAVAETLDITLTRTSAGGAPIPMAGIPANALERNIEALKGAGYSVAVAEQGPNGIGQIVRPATTASSGYPPAPVVAPVPVSATPGLAPTASVPATTAQVTMPAPSVTRMIKGKLRTHADAVKFAKVALYGGDKEAFLAEVRRVFPEYYPVATPAPAVASAESAIKAADPVAAVDATYEFTDATDTFKQAATSGGSDFATAEKMDAKAKELGLKVSWSVGKALLDSATGEPDDDEDDDGEDDDFDAEDDDAEEGDFDAEQEWDAVPELDSCGDEVPKPILDGDFKGHPFRGNKFKKVAHSSRAAVGSTLQAKTIERKGGTKKALKAAHKEAYYSHRAAMVSASGKTKRYHKKMAKLHAGRSGVEIMDSAAILDAAAGPQGLIGKVKKGVKIIGRISIGGDGKAMIFTGNAGKERVKTLQGQPAVWSDAYPYEAVSLLDYLVAVRPQESKGFDATSMLVDTQIEAIKALINEDFGQVTVRNAVVDANTIVVKAKKDGAITEGQMTELFERIQRVPLEKEAPNKPIDELTPDGRESAVKTAKGTEVVTGFAVVEADRLITSHDPATGDVNPQFPKELQPRDRGRETSRAWVLKTAANLDPEQLGKTRRADTGAPIVGKDRVVESGNGRTMAIIEAYRTGKADEYRAWLESEADYFGLSAGKVKAMKRPVLVRVRTSQINRAEFAVEANQDDKLAMTATEKARADANRLTEDMISLMTDNGDLNAAANTRFLSAFLTSLGDAEAAQYSTSEGKPTSSLIARVQAAIFAKAYNDDRLLELTADSAKPEIANIISALNFAAPEFIQSAALDPLTAGGATKKLTDAIEASLNEQAVAAIIGATNVIKQAKESGMQVDEFIKQQGLFGDLDPSVAAMAVFISKNNRSAKRMGAAFKAMATFVKGEIERRQTTDMFGEPVPIGFPEIIAAANRELERMFGEGAFAIETVDLFARPVEPPAAPAPTPAPTEDPQMTQDRTLFQSVIDGTVTTPDGEGILSATLADALEAAYMRHAGNADMDALFEKAINAYTEAEVAASANL